MSALEDLIEDIKPTVFRIVDDSGTWIPNFVERRIAEKYIRSTLITLIAKYGSQISSGLDLAIPITKDMFKEEYQKKIVLLKEIVDSPIGQFGSHAAIEAREQSNFRDIKK